MNKINPKHSIGKTTRINNMKKVEQNLESNIENMVKKLFARAEREVPEYGSFKLVYEEFKNTDKNLNATDFMLKISKPQGAENEKLRFLEAVAYDLPKPYISERLIASGNKEDILKALKNDNLKTELAEVFKNLAKKLEDI